MCPSTNNSSCSTSCRGMAISLSVCQEIYIRHLIRFAPGRMGILRICGLSYSAAEKFRGKLSDDILVSPDNEDKYKMGPLSVYFHPLYLFLLNAIPNCLGKAMFLLLLLHPVTVVSAQGTL